MLPLTEWKLFAPELPEGLTGFSRPTGFTLPGAKALEGFADLLGETAPPPDSEADESAQESAPFSLPAMLPQTLEGPVSLKREIDFGALCGDHAVLTFDHVIGSGRILLGGRLLCAFDGARFDADALAAQPCMLAVDLTDALEAGRREPLAIEFDESRPAGLPGPVLLHVTTGARMTHVSLTPDGKQQTVLISANIVCGQAGRYVLRAQGFTADGQTDAAWETALTLNANELQQAQFALPLPASPFVPGISYDAPAVKLQLFARSKNAPGDGLLCDSATLMCGYGAKAAECFLPLDRALAFGEPEKATEVLRALRIPAVSLNTPAPDGFYRVMTRAGIAVRQYLPVDHPLRKSLCRLPCVCLSDQPEPNAAVSLKASAWQMCSMVSLPRTLDETLSERELLLEASGLPLDPEDGNICDVLRWLRCVSVRLRAEAARQKRCRGALCSAGEWDNPDVADALRTAFAPLHLSALPLCGAWWTGTRFSASLEAFIPHGIYENDAKLTARAVLEDGDGNELARFEAPCRAGGGYCGVIDAVLPEHPCVLELTAQLLLGDEIIEESTLPVYVGERGPLEAAFG